MAARVAVVGSINMDLVVTTERLPDAGETILGSDFQRFGGGKGANQALAAARMGASVTLVGKVGTDQAVRALVGDLLRAGVEIGRIGRAEGATGTAIITVDSHGTNTIVVAPAANALLNRMTWQLPARPSPAATPFSCSWKCRWRQLWRQQP